MFEIEQFICIKMDLALNNLKMLIYHIPRTAKKKKMKSMIHAEFHFFYILI